MTSLRRLVPRDEILLRVVLLFLMFMMLLAYYAGNIIQNVPAGHAGVLWSRFFGGTVTERTFGEGIHLIFPWDKMYVYDVRTQHLTDSFEAVTLDGLSITLTLDVRYHVLPERAGLLHKYVGEEYRDKLIAPLVGAFSRTQVSRFAAEEVYSTQRLFIESEILRQVRRRRGIEIAGLPDELVFLHYDTVLLHGVALPPRFREAIESKVTQQQVQQEWRFRVEREQLEADRRVIEARATRDILAFFPGAAGETYLRLKAIEAMHSLAASHNAKIVVTGPNAPPVPIVVGADGQPPAAALAAEALSRLAAPGLLNGALAPAPTPPGSLPTLAPPTPPVPPAPAPPVTTTAPAIRSQAPAPADAR